MSDTAIELHNAADAAREAAFEVEDAVARAEIAEASIALANENEEAALEIAAEVMQSAMHTALGERLAAFETEVRACLEDLKLSLALLATPPSLSAVEGRLSKIEALIAELEAEEAEEAAEKQLTPPQSEATIAPQSLPKEQNKSAEAENPVKKRARTRSWI